MPPLIKKGKALTRHWGPNADGGDGARWGMADANGETQPVSQDFGGAVQTVSEDAGSTAWLFLVSQQRVFNL